MSMDDLTEFEVRVYEYCKTHDFEEKPWSTPKAAKALDASEDDVYEALSNLVRHLKGNFFLYYKQGAIRIQAD